MLKDVLIQKGLSNRESEVAELVTKGLANKDVASRLFVTEKTVKFHLTNIYKKMEVKSRAQLIVWCLPYMNFANPNPATPEATTATTGTEEKEIIPAGSRTVSGISSDEGTGTGTGTGIGV